MKSRNPLWNPEISREIHFEIQKFAWNPEISREIHFEIQKSALKSRNPLWNPEIHFEIQKSTLKSRNPLWNPEIQKSILKSEIHLKSSGFRNLVRRDAPWRTPRDKASFSSELEWLWVRVPWYDSFVKCCWNEVVPGLGGTFDTLEANVLWQ